MTAIETKQQFYTKAPVDWVEKPSIPQNEGNPQLGGLARAMTTAIEGKAVLISIDKMYSPGKEGTHQQILSEMQNIVLTECDELIDSATGLPSKETMQQWQNVVYLAPRIFGAISDMKGINDETILNAARFSIAAAKNPELMERALLNVGIGGNDDVRGTQRLPAYALSMVKTARDIGNIYESWTIIRRREEKAGAGLKKQDREVIEQAVKDPLSPIHNEARDLTDEFRQRNGIPRHGPTAEIFSGASAAAALNGIMDPERVRELNAKNLQVMRDFGSRLDVPFEVRDSLEWPEAGQPAERTMDILGRAKIDALAKELEAQEDKDYIRELESRGEKRGGEKGRAQSIPYAASHGPSFGDAQDLPPTQLFDNPRPTPSFIISDGSIREREFNAGRLENIRTASSEDLLEILDGKLQHARERGDIAMIANLEDAIGQTHAWMNLSAEDRAKRLPLYGSVMRTMDLAENPPYYFMEPVTLPLAVPVEGIPEGAELTGKKKVYEKTGEITQNGKTVKRKEEGLVVNYTLQGKEKTVYVVTEQVGKERKPAKFYEPQAVEQTVDLDLPLSERGIDTYEIARHMLKLGDAITNAEVAVQLNHTGDRTAVHLHLTQMKQVYADYEALYKELHHTWYTDSD